MPARSHIDTTVHRALEQRMHERRLLLAASCVVLLGLVLTYRAKTRSFDRERLRLTGKEIVNLATLTSERELLPVLAVIYPDSLDQRLAARHVFAQIQRRRARGLWHRGPANVGELYTASFAVPAQEAEAGGPAFQRRLAESRIRHGMPPNGKAPPPDTTRVRPVTAGPLEVRGCVRTREGQPLPEVTVRMRGTRSATTRTDPRGCYAFSGLAPHDTVTIRPWRPYTLFQEATFAGLAGNQVHHAVAREHRIRLIGSAEQLQRIKPRLIVRSPRGFTRAYWGLVVAYLAAVYGLHAFWFRTRFRGDAVLLPVVHLLTGLGLTLMFSLPDPLRDSLHARGFVTGVVAGCVLLGAVSRIDFQRAFWRRRAFVWLGAGVGLGTILFAFGSGPTGSEARVNLDLPWIGSAQPVELIKLCLVLFLSGYFARYAAFLRELAQREGLPRWLRSLDVPRYRDLIPVSAGVLAALATFFALKDMGPALVMGSTFLVLYGIARDRWPAVVGGMCALVAAFWIAYETRLVPMVAGRVAMLLDPWDNFVVGGEHLAHAFWAMSVGGIAGQGLGRGSPNYIPAAHTDMVLPALGEELGLLGLAAILSLYAALIYRALRISLRTGGLYSVFLGLGVTLLLLFQVLLIAGGTFGLLPLSGVVTPLLSYGKSSMIIHGILIGVLASLSARPGTRIQVEVQERLFGRPVRYLSGAALVVLGVLLLRALYVQVVVADRWTVKPALMLRASGKRAYVYNPRIADARRLLTRGTIYDRNGIPLATSRLDELERFRATYATMGVDVDAIDPVDTRFYPFEALTFYLLGDVRTRVKWGATNSLYVEHAYLSHLRGYDNHPRVTMERRTATGPPEPVVRYDYTPLTSLVRYGPTHRQARTLVQRDRDLRLTVDVRLQHIVADVLRARTPEGKTASVVVLDVATGDVLASVTYPLPDTAFTNPAVAHRDPTLFDRGFGAGAKPPGSTLKLVTAMAALNVRSDAAEWVHRVRASDRYARRGEPTGSVDLARAVIASSNVYFAALAHDVVGADSLVRMLERFGFGVGSAALSTREKVRLLEEPDNLRQAGFGQGPVTGSPLAVALVAATIANGGQQPDVRWVQHPSRPRRPGPYVVVPHHARRLAGYMRRVVTDREGTARSLRSIRIPMAGKTGTAEEVTYRVEDGARVRAIVNHAWFTGFAPYEAPGSERGIPKIAVGVLVEEGGSGGHVAAPIAGDVIEAAADLGLIVWPSPPETNDGHPAAIHRKAALPAANAVRH